MPTSENDRRNLQKPVLEQPSLPDHDRRKDAGMHSARPDTIDEAELMAKERYPTRSHPEIEMDLGALDEDESETAPPDQEFSQILQSGPRANQGRIPDDPNNWLTSNKENIYQDYQEQDPENRGESLPDSLEQIKH